MGYLVECFCWIIAVNAAHISTVEGKCQSFFDFLFQLPTAGGKINFDLPMLWNIVLYSNEKQ